jgi:hypothetical protein
MVKEVGNLLQEVRLHRRLLSGHAVSPQGGSVVNTRPSMGWSLQGDRRGDRRDFSVCGAGGRDRGGDRLRNRVTANEMCRVPLV